MSFGGGKAPVAQRPAAVPNIYKDQVAAAKADQARIAEELRAKRGRSSTLASAGTQLLDLNTTASASTLLS